MYMANCIKEFLVMLIKLGKNKCKLHYKCSSHSFNPKFIVTKVLYKKVRKIKIFNNLYSFSL